MFIWGIFIFEVLGLCVGVFGIVVCKLNSCIEWYICGISSKGCDRWVGNVIGFLDYSKFWEVVLVISKKE